MAAAKVFDYIVVGGGSSGAAVANRLSKHFKVCLVEAGPDPKKRSIVNNLVNIPMAVGFLVSYNKEINWCYHTTPQPGLNGRALFWPRGKMLGGCSALNGMVYQRGNAQDYDTWAAMGNEGWSYKELLPFFKEIEHYEPGLTAEAERGVPFDHAHHGVGGPMHISDYPSPNPLSKVFVAAGQEVGLPFNEDFNGDGKSQEGVGPFQCTARQGSRWSTAHAYLSEQALQGHELSIVTEALVSKVNIEGKRVTGVQVTPTTPGGGGTHTIHATKEVILSGGTVNSPQTLLLSGVGPKTHLEQLGIPCLHELRGVGENLQDHLNFRFTCVEDTSSSIGLSLRSLLRWALAPVQYLLGRGPFTSTLAEAGGFVKTDPALSAPDIQFHFYPSKIKRDMNIKSILGHGYGVQVCLLRPKSKGTLRLASADPREPPIIDPQYFQDPADLQTVLAGCKLARQILNAPAFASHKAEEQEPGKQVQSDAELAQYIQDNIMTIYHPTGTCKMGPSRDPMAVVAPTLKVHGLEGLRVADCSIMPNVVSGNTNMPAVCIGEKAASLILQEQGIC